MRSINMPRANQIGFPVSSGVVCPAFIPPPPPVQFLPRGARGRAAALLPLPPAVGRRRRGRRVCRSPRPPSAACGIPATGQSHARSGRWRCSGRRVQMVDLSRWACPINTVGSAYDAMVTRNPQATSPGPKAVDDQVAGPAELVASVGLGLEHCDVRAVAGDHTVGRADGKQFFFSFLRALINSGHV